MANRKYYVVCEDDCLFEGMTKEQILTAITQAVETGTITNIDTGFVTKVKEQNGGFVSFWVGTQAQYNALTEKQANCIYLKTDSTAEADAQAALARKQNRLAWVTEADLDAMIAGTYEGVEDEAPVEIVGSTITMQDGKSGLYYSIFVENGELKMEVG